MCIFALIIGYLFAKFEKNSKDKSSFESVLTATNELQQKKEEIYQLKESLVQKEINLDLEQKNLVKIGQEQKNEYQKKLEKISQLSSEEIKKQLFKIVEKNSQNQILKLHSKILNLAKETANLEAAEIVSMAIQRCSSEVVNEATVTLIKLTDENDKGKLIGKAGKNLQWIEKNLGVELIIDNTPNSILISGYNSIRRHIAKKTLEELLLDGRIHPASIEEYAQKAKDELEKEVLSAGNEAVLELGIVDFPEELVKLIGRLKFRTSYGQNMLKHSLEMAQLASLLATEIQEKFGLVLDKNICIKGALLHDVGKAIDEEQMPKGDHIEIGEQICSRYNLGDKIRKCITSHHDESYQNSDGTICLEAIIVDACDNISGGRLGARKETTKAYLDRLEALESIANNIKGVEKAWVMRGAKELWVFFDTKVVLPTELISLTNQISTQIESTLLNPSKIKIVGFWEEKIIHYTK